MIGLRSVLLPWAALLPYLVIGCGSDERDEVFPILKSFEHEAHSRGVEVKATHIPIEWFVNKVEFTIGGRPHESLRGQCIERRGQRIIQLESKWWEKMPEWEREMLVFHELGHCVLNRPHMDWEFVDGCPFSMMHANLAVIRPCYKQNREYYLDELFGLIRLSL